MNDNENLNFILNEYNIDKDKYLNSISNANYYNRENVVEKDIDISNLICPICYYILKDPRFCSSNNNSHSFCKECIDKYLETKNNCPLCKNIFENKIKDEIENKLHKLEFKCLFFKEGCTKVVNYLEYSNHILGCKYNNLLYNCQIDTYNYLNKEFEKCNYKGNKDEIKDHFKKCALIKYNCLFCNENILKINLKEHVEKKCKLGIFKYLMNDKYIGENKNKIKEGYGIMYYSNGNRYEGEWKNDKKDGYGIYYLSNGNKYEGEFKSDKLDGNGIIDFLNGNKYEGEWKNDGFDNFGIMYYSNGDKYEGEFINEIKHGYGIYYFSTGGKYEGEFKNDKIEGYGIRYYSNGNRYEGGWRNNKKEGYGVKNYSNGNRYKG